MNLPDFLTRDPDGEVHVTGSRIGLYTIVRLRDEGYSAERMAEEFDSLPPELIRQVLAFAEDNRAEVDAYAEACRQEIERQAAAPPGPGILQLRRQRALIERGNALYGFDPEWCSLSIIEKLRCMEQQEGPEAP
jgi:uncharacterized protein (DUF433 family)